MPRPSGSKLSCMLPDLIETHVEFVCNPSALLKKYRSSGPYGVMAASQGMLNCRIVGAGNPRRHLVQNVDAHGGLWAYDWPFSAEAKYMDVSDTSPWVHTTTCGQKSRVTA